MSNCVRLAKKVLKLSENQPMGAIQDADTVLADIMGKSDFQVTRISDELLKMYLDVENKDDFESLFFLIADETFEEYLTKSRDVMQKNINYGTPRVVKVILNDGKFSIFKTTFPKTHHFTHIFQKSANTNTRTLISSKTRFSTSYLYG